MDVLETLAKLTELPRTRRELLAAGYTDDLIQRMVKREEVVRLNQGHFVRTADWCERTIEEQHLLRAICVHRGATQPPIFSHRTAAALLGLPLLRVRETRVHIMQPRDGYSSTRHSIRHRQEFHDDEIEETYGFRHTNLLRTLIDIARVGTAEQAVVLGDAVLRQLRTTKGSRYSQEQHRQLLIERLLAHPRSRGARRARSIIEFIDDSAESPLESLYRVQLARLGFDFTTQVPVRSRTDTTLRMDFELLGHDAFFEADGLMKYTDERYRNGKTLDEIVLDSKFRDEWVYGTTGRRVLHGGWDEAMTARKTATLLRHHRVTPPVDLGATPRFPY